MEPSSNYNERNQLIMQRQDADLDNLLLQAKAQQQEQTYKTNAPRILKEVDTIILNLGINLKNYIDSRSNLGFFDSFLFNDQLTQNRLNLIATPLFNRIHQITNMNAKVYTDIKTAIQTAFDTNSQLTTSAQANQGELNTLLSETLAKLSAYTYISQYAK